MTAPRDWADDMADEILQYLAKCQTSEQEADLIAAYLRCERSAGRVDAAKDMATALGAKPKENSDG